jgi:hypothetical protein
MANTSYQEQLTQIYNKLVAIDSQLSELALKSEMNTMQVSLTNSMSLLSNNLATLTATVEKLELTMSSLLSELRSH